MNDLLISGYTSTQSADVNLDPGIIDSHQFSIGKIVRFHTSATKGSYPPRNFPRPLDRSFRTLEQICQLTKDWNGYGADPISDGIIQKVKAVLSDLERQPEIFPTARNSVQLEYEKENNDYLEFEFFEDSIRLYMETNGAEEENQISITDIPGKVLQFYAGY